MTTVAANIGVQDAGASRLKHRTLFITALGYFIAILDTTAKNVALPQIGRDLHASVSGLQWVIDGYLLVFASLLLTAGALSDRYGGRRLFTLGMSVFGVASLLSALAQNQAELISAQLLAGMGAALLTPASLALLAVTFTDLKERGRAIGVWAAVAGAGMCGGPLIGGALVTLAGWRAVFLVNIPIAAAGVILPRLWLGESRRNPSRALDVPGQLTAVLFLSALSYGLIEGGSQGWSAAPVVGALVLAAAALAGFVLTESLVAAPMVPLRLFRHSRFSASVFAGSTINFGTYSQMFLLALYFQAARGYGALLTGVAELPMTLLCVALPVPAGRAVARFGPRLPLSLGLFGCGIGALALTGLTVHSPYALAVPGLAVIGLGMAFSIPSVAAAAMSGVAPTEAGAASGILNTARNTGGVLGVSVLGTLVGARIGGQLGLALAITAVVQILGGLAVFVFLRPARSTSVS